MELEVRKNSVVCRRVNPLWPYGNWALRAETGQKFITVSAREEHRVRPTAPSAESLQPGGVFQCLSGIIMLQLIKHTE